jgi:hypothetical protein
MDESRNGEEKRPFPGLLRDNLDRNELLRQSDTMNQLLESWISSHVVVGGIQL